MNKQPSNTDISLKIVLVGEGGQGIQTIAKILTRAAFQKRYHVSYLPNFGTEQRGGLSLAFVQLSRSPIISPKFKTADICLIVSNRDTGRSRRYIGPMTHVVYDSGIVEERGIRAFRTVTSNVVPINAFNTTSTQLSERSFNIALLGMLTGLIDIELQTDIIRLMDEKFAKYYLKDTGLKSLNHKAFDLGLTLTKHA